MVVCFLITPVVRESHPDPEPWCGKLAADSLTVAGGSCGMETDPQHKHSAAGLRHTGLARWGR